MSGAIQVIGMVGTVVWNMFVWSSIVVFYAPLLRADPAYIRVIRLETKPFALPALLVSFCANAMTGDVDWLDRGLFVVNLWVWWVWWKHKDDDDRWKRRRQKLADKVSEVGGKLQVVPAGAS